MEKKNVCMGILTGFANGLFGSGGGTVGVLLLEKWKKLEAHKSHATILAIILPLSILSALIYGWKVDMEWGPVALHSLGGIAGGYAGASWLKKLSNAWLHRIFGACMLAAAVRMML